MITPYGLRALMKWMATNGEIPRYQDAYASLDRCFRSRRDPWNFETDVYRIFARIPVLHRASCRYLRLLDAEKVVNRHGCRIVLWWSGAFTEDVLQSMQTESRRGARERAPSGSERPQTRGVQ